jgi:hypothetical protein
VYKCSARCWQPASTGIGQPPPPGPHLAPLPRRCHPEGRLHALLTRPPLPAVSGCCRPCCCSLVSSPVAAVLPVHLPAPPSRASPHWATPAHRATAFLASSAYGGGRACRAIRAIGVHAASHTWMRPSPRPLISAPSQFDQEHITVYTGMCCDILPLEIQSTSGCTWGPGAQAAHQRAPPCRERQRPARTPQRPLRCQPPSAPPRPHPGGGLRLVAAAARKARTRPAQEPPAEGCTGLYALVARQADDHDFRVDF